MQTSPGSRQPSVVIIEDEVGIASAIGITLRSSGYETHQMSGPFGLSEALTRNPIAIILDVSLGDADAVDVIRLLGQAGYTGCVQLISGGRPTLLENVRRVGERHRLRMLPVLRKPFRMSEIRDAISSHVGSVSLDAGSIIEPPAVTCRIQADLATCLDGGFLEVWYQPKFDLADGLAVGAEALARVNHPNFGLLQPGSFLPGASDAALSRLTDIVIRQACRDWTYFAENGSAPRLAVNITATQLTGMGLTEIVRAAAPSSPDWPGLVLEITEEDALLDLEGAHEAATQLAIHGIELSIDDFGQGYSSLARLGDLPFREIKLDRSLVHGCAAHDTRTSLCRAVIELARAMRVPVVAEGVESSEDLLRLRSMGCDQAQGFLLGRPMPAIQLAQVLRSRSPHIPLTSTGSLPVAC